jgi:hypothetical protein
MNNIVHRLVIATDDLILRHNLIQLNRFVKERKKVQLFQGLIGKKKMLSINSNLIIVTQPYIHSIVCREYRSLIILRAFFLSLIFSDSRIDYIMRLIALNMDIYIYDHPSLFIRMTHMVKY